MVFSSVEQPLRDGHDQSSTGHMKRRGAIWHDQTTQAYLPGLPRTTNISPLFTRPSKSLRIWIFLFAPMPKRLLAYAITSSQIFPKSFWKSVAEPNPWADRLRKLTPAVRVGKRSGSLAD